MELFKNFDRNLKHYYSENQYTLMEQSLCYKRTFNLYHRPNVMKCFN